MNLQNLFAPISLLALLDCQAPATRVEPFPEETAEETANFAHDLSTVRDGKPIGEGAKIDAWPNETISYAFDGFAPHLDESAYKDEVRAALAEWTRATLSKRTFFEIPNPHQAQVVFGFRPADHSGSERCPDSFTNRRKTIAHAYTFDSTCLAGIIHLNQDLAWVMDGSNRKGTYDVRYAVLHEVGHILGLSHVNKPGHIMHAEYIGVVRALTEEESQNVLAVIDGR